MTSRIRRLVIPGGLLALSVQLALAQGLPRAQPEEVGLSSERLERLSDAMQTYVDDGHLAGAVAIVVRRGKVAYLEAFGYGDLEAGAPMAADLYLSHRVSNESPYQRGGADVAGGRAPVDH